MFLTVKDDERLPGRFLLMIIQRKATDPEKNTLVGKYEIIKGNKQKWAGEGIELVAYIKDVIVESINPTEPEKGKAPNLAANVMILFVPKFENVSDSKEFASRVSDIDGIHHDQFSKTAHRQSEESSIEKFITKLKQKISSNH